MHLHLHRRGLWHVEDLRVRSSEPLVARAGVGVEFGRGAHSTNGMYEMEEMLDTQSPHMCE